MNIILIINEYANLLLEEEIELENNDNKELEETRTSLISTNIKYSLELSKLTIEEQISLLNLMQIKYEELEHRLNSLKLNYQNNNKDMKELKELELHLSKYELIIDDLEKIINRKINSSKQLGMM